MQMAGTSRTGEVVRSATPKTPKAPPARDPSWGRVLATTISLWTARRVPRLRRPRLTLSLAFGMVVAAAAVVTAVQLTAAPARTASPASPHRAAARAGAPAAAGPAAGPGAAGTAAGIRAQAAAWVAGQVSSDQSIACDPVMCTALGGHGVASGRLMPLGPTTGSLAANVVVTSPAGHAQASQAQASQDGPVLLASFGTGSSRVEVRATAPGGAAAYAQAQQADLAARRSGGAQLLHSKSIQAGAEASAQLQAGQVDSRILIMLAMLASQHSWRVVAFSDSSPGVPLADAPLRQVTIAGTDAKAVAAALVLVHAQRAPYAPAQASVVRLAGGQPGLRIDFAAPAPLGLLTGNASG
jgi:hypothetical protein